MALSTERGSKKLVGPERIRSLPVAASTTIYKGGIVVLHDGYAEPGAVAADFICVGTAVETVDNSSGSNGDLRVRVSDAPHGFDTAGGADTLDEQDIGATCYIVDDETVALTDDTGARSAAGEIYDVKDGQIFFKPAAGG